LSSRDTDRTRRRRRSRTSHVDCVCVLFTRLFSPSVVSDSELIVARVLSAAVLCRRPSRSVRAPIFSSPAPSPKSESINAADAHSCTRAHDLRLIFRPYESNAASLVSTACDNIVFVFSELFRTRQLQFSGTYYTYFESNEYLASVLTYRGLVQYNLCYFRVYHTHKCWLTFADKIDFNYNL